MLSKLVSEFRLRLCVYLCPPVTFLNILGQDIPWVRARFVRPPIDWLSCPTDMTNSPSSAWPSSPLLPRVCCMKVLVTAWWPGCAEMSPRSSRAIISRRCIRTVGERRWDACQSPCRSRLSLASRAAKDRANLRYFFWIFAALNLLPGAGYFFSLGSSALATGMR